MDIDIVGILALVAITSEESEVVLRILFDDEDD
jgi:hypothetical protein